MNKTIAQQLNVKDFPFKIRDKQGNVLYLENSNGDWIKKEYDSAGNKRYYEDSNEFWYKSEYDSAGNQRYYEDSNEFWYKSEYDSVGNEIYHENSRGEIRDDRPKPDDVITLNGIKYKRIDQ